MDTQVDTEPNSKFSIRTTKINFHFYKINYSQNNDKILSLFRLSYSFSSDQAITSLHVGQVVIKLIGLIFHQVLYGPFARDKTARQATTHPIEHVGGSENPSWDFDSEQLFDKFL